MPWLRRVLSTGLLEVLAECDVIKVGWPLEKLDSKGTTTPVSILDTQLLAHRVMDIHLQIFHAALYMLHPPSIEERA